MKRIILVTCLAIAGWGGVGLTAHPALAATFCVGRDSDCYTTIQAALDAAHDGDVIRIGPGTFQGGISITKSVTIIGAGARDQGDDSGTAIKGGGPVMTIGEFGASTEPTVSLTGLTITGGLTTSSPESLARFGTSTVLALGGGIAIPPNASRNGGATVTISNSAITGNRAVPTSTVPSGVAICPGNVSCPFALAAGGGIYNRGALTLINTTVSNNEVGSASGIASDAEGGGVASGWFRVSGGTLTLRHSRITGNRATATAPNGRFAEGGGLFASNGVPLTISNSAVDANIASLSSTLPASVSEMGVNGGAIHHNDTGSVTIVNSDLSGNAVSEDDLNGEPLAIDSAMNPGVYTTVVIRKSTIRGNTLTATVGSTADVGPSGDTIEFDAQATITNTEITGNISTVISPTGTAGVTGAIAALDNAAQTAVISNSVISDNVIRAVSGDGPATVQGAAVINNGLLELRNDRISGNSGVATGPAGLAQGGGIYNGSLIISAPVQLTVENTSVTHNALTASPGLPVQGAGLFTPGFPVTLTNSVIAGNVPDQCFGVAC